MSALDFTGSACHIFDEMTKRDEFAAIAFLTITLRDVYERGFRAGTAEEREAIAQMVHGVADNLHSGEGSEVAADIAYNIRARGAK